MKKFLSIVVLLLFISPYVFAESAKAGIALKGGYLFSPEATLKPSGARSVSFSDESTISLGAEGFVSNFFNDSYKNDNFDLETVIGLSWSQKHVVDDDNFKIGFTNIYIGLKPKFSLQSEKERYIFLILHLGYGFPSIKDDTGLNYSVSNSPYWAVGIGFEEKNFIFELLYSCNYMSVSVHYEDEYYIYTASAPCTYTALRLNIGYKINF